MVLGSIARRNAGGFLKLTKGIEMEEKRPALEREVSALQQRVAEIEIRTPDDLLVAADLSDRVAKMRKAVAETFDPIIRKTNEAHKEALAQKKRFMDPLDRQQHYVDVRILAWRQQQEQIRRRQEAELAAQRKKELDDQAIAEAQEFVRQGEHALAEEVIKQQAAAPAPVVALPSTVPKIATFATKTNWRFRIEDKNRVRKTSIIPDEYWILDELRIGGIVRTLKGATNIPGVEIYPEESPIHLKS
jgi:hypothetical protein